MPADWLAMLAEAEGVLRDEADRDDYEDGYLLIEREKIEEAVDLLSVAQKEATR